MKNGVTWVPMMPTLQRRCALRGYGFMPTVSDLSPEQAWHAFQTIRRWHERGHAERAREIVMAFKGSGHIGRVDGFRFIQGAEEGVKP